MNIFISGGCKNGKSHYAQRQARNLAVKNNAPLYYIATMIPGDEEDRDRIKRHIQDRAGWGFETIERPVKLMGILEGRNVDRRGSFLLDSVTAILENEMFPRIPGPGGEGTGEVREDCLAGERVKGDMIAFAKAIKEAGGSVVFVSDGIYSDAVEYGDSTERYRKSLGEIDRALAEECERVVEISAGVETIWK